MFPTWPAKSELPRSRKHASPTAPKGGRELEEVEVSFAMGEAQTTQYVGEYFCVLGS